jgi:hypothetical protein
VKYLTKYKRKEKGRIAKAGGKKQGKRKLKKRKEKERFVCTDGSFVETGEKE